jgi:predicted branched-subunit amino acid permease
VKPAQRREIERDSLSIALTVGTYGIAFGAAGVAAGLTVLQTCALSLLTFTGASQFAAVGVLGAGGSVVSAVTAAALLGTRNTLYGLRVSPFLKATGLRRVAAAHLVIDESTAVGTSQEDHGEEAMRFGFYLTGIGIFVFWNIFTALGALGAAQLDDPGRFGLDAAVPAAFLGLLWPRLIAREPWAVAAGAAIIALVLVPFAPAGVPIIASVIAAIIVGWKR